MTRITVFALTAIVVCFVSCSKKPRISPVTGTINGKPAITLYGSSYKPTDYILVDTLAADKLISYEGIVFTYTYLTPGNDNIFFSGTGLTFVRGELSIGAKTILTIDTSYNITFGSKVYTSN